MQWVLGWRAFSGFYSRAIFPRVADLIMRRPTMARLRKALLADVRGEVLEIGFGSGLNLPYYPKHVTKITAVDRNIGMSALARRRIQQSLIPVESRILNAERLPMADDAFDSVVSTWTLCSIAEVGQALKEIRRVLKPGGRFFFLEHGLSDDPTVQAWQHRLTPLNRILADGCNLNRNIQALIEAAGFKIVALERFYLEKTPRVFGAMYRGIATKA